MMAIYHHYNSFTIYLRELTGSDVYINDKMPAELKAIGQAFKTVVGFTLPLPIGSPIVGVLSDLLGIQAVFRIGAAWALSVTAVFAVLFARIGRRERSPRDHPAEGCGAVAAARADPGRGAAPCRLRRRAARLHTINFASFGFLRISRGGFGPPTSGPRCLSACRALAGLNARTPNRLRLTCQSLT